MNKIKVHIIITALAMLLFLPGLGVTPLFDWDELNFAESAREMNLSNNWYYVQVAFEPFWEKPPLFIWIQAFFVSLFGEHTWVFRLPNALAGIVTVNLAYHIGCYLEKRALGVFWALAMAFTFAPMLYFKLGIIDPIFNLFIFLSIWHWYRITRCESENTRPHWHYLMVGVFLGLAILTKGQAALLIVGLVALIATAYRGRWHDIISTRIFIALLGLTLVLGGWIFSVYQHLGAQFFESFIRYQLELVQGQIAWHNQPWFYHVLVLLFLCFPSSSLALPYLFKRGEEDYHIESWHAIQRILFWVVLLIFSIVTTKIIHYSSLCWFPLTYFAGYHAYLVHTQRSQNHWIQKLFLLITAVGLLAAFIALPLVFGRDNIPAWANPYLDGFSRGLIFQHDAWHWTALIPATLMIVLVFPWIVKNFMVADWHPGKLFMGFSLVSLSTYFFLLPPAEKLLQNELVSTVKSQVKITPYVETQGFKSFSVYYHGRLSPNDFKGPWLTDTFVLNRTKNQAYPIQTGKRIWIKDVNHKQDARLITKCNYQADRYFRYQFNLIDSEGAYFVWQRKR